MWELYNFTVDAHPIHIHEVLFEVVNRQRIDKAHRFADPGADTARRRGRTDLRTRSSPTRAK